MNLVSDLGALWHPGVVLCLQTAGVFILYYLGRSPVTSSTICFKVVQDQV